MTVGLLRGARGTQAAAEGKGGKCFRVQGGSGKNWLQTLLGEREAGRATSACGGRVQLGRRTRSEGGRAWRPATGWTREGSCAPGFRKFRGAFGLTGARNEATLSGTPCAQQAAGSCGHVGNPRPPGASAAGPAALSRDAGRLLLCTKWQRLTEVTFGSLVLSHRCSEGAPRP